MLRFVRIDIFHTFIYDYLYYVIYIFSTDMDIGI